MGKKDMLWTLCNSLILNIRHGKQSLLADKINQFQAHEFQMLMILPFTFKIYHKNGVAFLLAFTNM